MMRENIAVPNLNNICEINKALRHGLDLIGSGE
jgi:hypothetical protein